MQVGKIEYAPNYGHKDGVTVPLDTAARQAVEGVPCYMYGIRAPEDDELPVAEQPATEVPEDIMQAATDWLSGRRLAFYEESGPKTLIETVARAILAERKRCADIVRDEKPYWCGDDHDGGREIACIRILECIESGQ